jgi:hypothetical protein
MCYWCDPDAEMPQFASKTEHDLWLYPHGRYGYTPSEKIDANRAACKWCQPARFAGILDYLNGPGTELPS